MVGSQMRTVPYTYFPSKAAVLQGVVERILGEVEHDVSEGRRFESGSRLRVSAGEGDFVVSSLGRGPSADHRSTTLASEGSSSAGPESERRASCVVRYVASSASASASSSDGDRWP